MKSEYASPGKFLKKLGVERPEEIDIEAIAEYCGATILYESLGGCEGRIIGYGDRACITVNKTSSRPRQRFSGAHELGHWMRDRERINAFTCTAKMFSTEWSTNNPERRANTYAAELLMPDFLFRKDAVNRSITLASVRELASLYQTSLSATALRLVELGNLPGIVLCHQLDGSRWKWFSSGADVPKALWPRDLPGRNTLAHELLKGTSSENRGPVDVAADGWFDHREAVRYVVREDSERFGDMILTLLWWKDESQLVDLLEDI